MSEPVALRRACLRKAPVYEAIYITSCLSSGSGDASFAAFAHPALLHSQLASNKPSFSSRPGGENGT